MQTIRIVCVGKCKEKYWRDACAEYEKRLSAFCRFEILEVEEERLPDKPSQAQILQGLEQEGKRLLRKTGTSTMIALCVEGKELSSPELSQKLQGLGTSGVGAISFVIGGSWGLWEEVKKKAAFRLSMSPMTFPHQLARVMVCEQVYRAFQIMSGGKYHK